MDVMKGSKKFENRIFC